MASRVRLFCIAEEICIYPRYTQASTRVRALSEARAIPTPSHNNTSTLRMATTPRTRCRGAIKEMRICIAILKLLTDWKGQK